MRKKALGVVVAAGLLVGVVAAPASAKGCPTIGQAWSAWAKAGPSIADSTGEWTGQTARSGTQIYYPVEDGPGVIARVISFYCED